MNIRIAEEINGKKTYLIKCIWMSIFGRFSRECIRYGNLYREQFGKSWDDHEGTLPKPHIILKGNEFKAGDEITFISNEFQFAPVVECVSVQKIKIEHNRCKYHTIEVLIDGMEFNNRCLNEYGVIYDDYLETIQQLATNEGFSTVKRFFEYFSEDFEGQIVHWTDLKY